MLCTDQLCTDQCAQPALIFPSAGVPRNPYTHTFLSYRPGGAHPYSYYAHLPFLPPSIVAKEAFNCAGLEHAFDMEDHVDVARLDAPDSLFFDCNRQLCPNRTLCSITVEDRHFVPIRRIQHPLGQKSTHTSRSASCHVTPIPS
ncbi:hypothetical protein POSPLADRAFT_1163406 [Postia placenta MAD-698-R-SB12]|uniref:Uncharacterized protein n=1 Tax=Postia placenta MAD-698-R-SB12 TaxID=670580 RepID=A0A1X6MHC1_9APHY|nr:hypothetical protein POSPLADRAFT_1163406 [Postia placenta MAD-698-R-SB12]OSX55748.1 hypothetical protein POSPLADRAFT_1163406 [Postia placenta MAD-698-R-SB12]